MASRECSRRTRRGGRERAGALCRPGPDAWRRGCRGGLSRGVRAADGRSRRSERNEPLPPRRPSTRPAPPMPRSRYWQWHRLDRLMSCCSPVSIYCGQRSRSPCEGETTLHRSYLRQPSDWNPSTSDWHVKPTSRRSRPPSSSADLSRGADTAQVASSRTSGTCGTEAELRLRSAPRRTGAIDHRWPCGRYPAAQACGERLSRARTSRPTERLRWLWLAGRVAQDLWDDESWEVLCADHVRTRPAVRRARRCFPSLFAHASSCTASGANSTRARR